MSAAFLRMRSLVNQTVYFSFEICYNSIGLMILELAKQF